MLENIAVQQLIETLRHLHFYLRFHIYRHLSRQHPYSLLTHSHHQFYQLLFPRNRLHPQNLNYQPHHIHFLILQKKIIYNPERSEAVFNIE